MKHLVKIMVVMALFFALTFLLVKATGMLTVEQIKTWLAQAKELSPYYIGGIVVLLLLTDLFIAVPTMTTITFAGYFLGFPNGAIASIIGLMLAGLTGYGLSRLFGDRLFAFLLKKKAARQEAKATFRQYSVIMVLLSRATPILPEVTACLAGMTNMKFSKFILAWSASIIPYALVISYAGSISSLENPMPAIYAATGISATLWTGWYLFNAKRKRATNIQTNVETILDKRQHTSGKA